MRLILNIQINNLYLYYQDKYKNLSKSDILEILCVVLKIKKIDIYTNKHLSAITKIQKREIEEKLEQLLQGKPLAYILNHCHFYQTYFYVDQRVLIPRYETEEVLLKALNIICEIEKKLLTSTFSVLDIGTGSGILAISIQKAFPDIQIYAIDFSQDALNVAMYNEKKNKLNSRINWICGDITSKDILQQLSIPFNVIISNPPYIDIESLSKEEIDKSVWKFEPHQALFTKNRGLFIIESILKMVPSLLKKNGYGIIEIGYNQKKLIENLLEKPSIKQYIKNFNIEKDINNKDRCLILQKK